MDRRPRYRLQTIRMDTNHLQRMRQPNRIPATRLAVCHMRSNHKRTKNLHKLRRKETMIRRTFLAITASLGFTPVIQQKKTSEHVWLVRSAYRDYEHSLQITYFKEPSKLSAVVEFPNLRDKPVTIKTHQNGVIELRTTDNWASLQLSDVITVEIPTRWATHIWNPQKPWRFND